MPTLTIVSRQEGFRRAGHVFGAQPVEIDAKDLSDEQVAALKAEPMLIVVESAESAQSAEPADPEVAKGKKKS